jgi:hypothetical protein
VNFCSATMASKKDKEKIDSIPLVLKPESTPFTPSPPFLPIFIDPPIYISLPSSQHLFYIEKNHSHIKSPKQLILSYFPPDFHWIPEHPKKNLVYYTNILIQTKSVHIKLIFSKTSGSPKLSGTLASLTNFISEKDWGTHLFCILSRNTKFLGFWHGVISSKVSGLKDIGFKLNYETIVHKLMLLSMMLKN